MGRVASGCCRGRRIEFGTFAGPRVCRQSQKRRDRTLPLVAQQTHKEKHVNGYAPSIYCYTPEHRSGPGPAATANANVQRDSWLHESTVLGASGKVVGGHSGYVCHGRSK